MILVRDVFEAKFDSGEAAILVLKEGAHLIRKNGNSTGTPRLLMDFAGPFFTIVLETTHSSLAEYENALAKLMENKEYQTWYETVVPLMKSGRREIFTIIE
ncbi:MAG: hypothetical protein ACE5GL_05225 [Calditrichia bacterium]